MTQHSLSCRDTRSGVTITKCCAKTANALPLVKQRIRSLDLGAAIQRAQLIMDQSDSGHITALLDDFNALA